MPYGDNLFNALSERASLVKAWNYDTQACTEALSWTSFHDFLSIWNTWIADPAPVPL
jgi:hypothetical protein